MLGEFVLDASLSKNLKFRDLSKRLASPALAMWTLVRLWSFAAMFRQDGDLTGIDPAEVPLTEAEWKALKDARKPGSIHGFLDVEGEVVVLHDWRKQQAYVASSAKRVQAAKKAGQASVAVRVELERQRNELAELSNGRLTKLQEAVPLETGHSTEIVQRALATDVNPQQHDGTTDRNVLIQSGSLTPEGFSTLVDQRSLIESQRSVDSLAEASVEGPPLVLVPQPSGKRKPPRESPLIDHATNAWLDKHFEWFYDLYPKKEKRVLARVAWGKLHRDLLVSGPRQGISKSVREKIARYVLGKLQSGDWEVTPDRKRFIPDPPVFLNQRRWED